MPAGLGSKGFLLSAHTEPGGFITIDATLLTCPFTFDPSDNTIIYFNFMGADAVGTIEYGNLKMAVAKA